MKQFIFTVFSLLILWFIPANATVIDSQIEDAINEKAQNDMIKDAEELNEKITFTKVNSCESMEKVFWDFLETYKKLNPKRDYHRYYFDYGVNKWMMFDDAEMVYETSAAISNDIAVESALWTPGWNFSTTNIQKAWVDEPEILKSNWEYLFYYTQENYSTAYISIIKAPKNSDLSDAEISAKIKIPENLHNIQLFLNWNKLVILWSRYSKNYDDVMWANRSIIIVYDISDLDNLKLEKLTEVYGDFNDARMINDQIYVISSINPSWYEIAWGDKPRTFNEMKPRLTDISLKEAGKWINSYSKKTTTLDCNNIFYLLPSEETMKESGIYPNFTLISQISLSDLDKTPTQNLVFGNVNEIHMSKDSLYLPSPIYLSRPTSCGLFGCISSWYYKNENTLVHKFNLWKTVTYKDSTIIAWEPLNQYSMDEDSDWNFRILTTTRYDKKATHLSILDKDLKLVWNLMNIEPGENFKSSRYIGDKLYLVTYQNIDPLFVVDLEDIKNPKIIWELKIPGYSTYLHPYAEAKDWVQYLIWLWYSTEDNWYGWLKQWNTKVDLYKIDYNENETAETKCSSLITKNVNSDLTDSCSTISKDNKCNEEQRLYEDCLTKVNPENIAVSLVASHEFTGDSSETPAAYNPRVFVWRANKQELILPVFISNILEQWNRENNWKYKYDNFIGLKWLSIKSSTALIKEILSENFASNNNDYYWDFDMARVWYIDDLYYFLNKWLIAFIKNWEVATIGK